MIRHSFSVAAAAALSLSVSGCSVAPARLALPADMPVSAESYPVTGHSVRHARAPVAFGPWATRDNAGHVGEHTTVHVKRLAMGESARDYRFMLVRDANPVWRGNCASSTTFVEWRFGRQARARIPNDMQGPALVCMFNGERGHAELTVSEVGAGWEGDLTVGAQRYALQTLNRVEGVPVGMAEGIGFAIRDGEKTLAVIDLLGEGRVAFAPGLDPALRDILAAATSALLLKA